MSEPHAIYITGIDFERDAWQGHAVRGLRALWEILDPDDVRGYREARERVLQFADSPHEAVLVGTYGDIDDLREAADKALDLSENVLTFDVDLEDTTLAVPEAPAEEDEDHGEFSPAAYQTALVHLAFTGGNWVLAFNRTYAMSKASDDESLWEEVRAVYLSVFTHEGPESPDGPTTFLVQ